MKKVLFIFTVLFTVHNNMRAADLPDYGDELPGVIALLPLDYDQLPNEEKVEALNQAREYFRSMQPTFRRLQEPLREDRWRGNNNK